MLIYTRQFKRDYSIKIIKIDGNEVTIRHKSSAGEKELMLLKGDIFCFKVTLNVTADK
jgi:hypothetical protein